MLRSLLQNLLEKNLNWSKVKLSPKGLPHKPQFLAHNNSKMVAGQPVRLAAVPHQNKTLTRCSIFSSWKKKIVRSSRVPRL